MSRVGSFVVAGVVFLAVFFSSGASACPTTPFAESIPSEDNAEEHFNRVGAIFQGARDADPNCATEAREQLVAYLDDRIDRLNTDAYRFFLGGAYLTFVFSSALELGQRGLMTRELDWLVRKVGDDYTQLTKEPTDPCGLLAPDPPGSGHEWSRRGNNCMDDYMIAASGFGWKAAYYRLSGRSYTAARTRAVTDFRNGLGEYESVCIHSPALYDAIRGMSGVEERFCNQTMADLDVNGDAGILSLNHGNQTPAYGFGLLTSGAAMHTALEVAEHRLTSGELSTNDKKALKYLWKEAAVHTSNGGDFLSDCRDIVDEGPYKVLGPYNITCGDEGFGGIYRAKFYPLYQLFTEYGYTRVNGNGFAFNSFDPAPFQLTTPDAFLGTGRYETYKTLAWDWLGNARPALSAGSSYRMSVRTSGGSYLYATGAGGSTLTANGGANVRESTFYLEDTTANIGLRSNDYVALRMANYAETANYYVNAVSSSTVNVTATSPTGTALFKIVKVSGSTGAIIGHLDKFALLASNGQYLIAQGGGFGVVTADGGTTISTFGTFTFNKTEASSALTY